CPNCTPCSTSRTVPVGSRSAIFFTREINGSRRSSRSILRTRSPNLMVGRLPDRSGTTTELPARTQPLTTLFPGSPVRWVHDGRGRGEILLPTHPPVQPVVSRGSRVNSRRTDSVWWPSSVPVVRILPGLLLNLGTTLG